MGDLVKTPHSEVTATLEVLDRFGVAPEHLAKLRAASTYIQQMVAQAIILCREDFFADSQNSHNRAIFCIDRSQPFNPTTFIGDGWTIWKGPADGNGLEGEEEQDARALALTEVDLSKVCFETGLESREGSIIGEEKLKRLKKAGHIRLDAKVFQTLWQNQSIIPESWKKKIDDNIRYIFFDGTILRGPGGGRYVLSLCWYDGRPVGLELLLAALPLRRLRPFGCARKLVLGSLFL